MPNPLLPLAVVLGLAAPPDSSALADENVLRQARLHTLLQGLDTGTTLAGISRGGRELNPVLSLFPNHPYASVLIPKAGLTTAIPAMTSKMSKEDAKKTYNIINAIYGLILLNNLRQLAK